MTGTAVADWRPTARLGVLELRARLLGTVRAHFAATGALEVETPVLVGAAVTDVHLESLEVRRSDGFPRGVPADLARVRDEAPALCRRARPFPGRARVSARASAGATTIPSSRWSSGTGSAWTTTR